jgi:hypothetical protein
MPLHELEADLRRRDFITLVGGASLLWPRVLPAPDHGEHIEIAVSLRHGWLLGPFEDQRHARSVGIQQ